ncbi:MAG: DUF3783 domain-containing protein [Treponema sp.]|jgi:hypothetical protein|nr:DUF3783 domain-containing protein [Treponema sp.]
MDNPVVLVHGVEEETLIAIVRAIKKAAVEAGVDPAAIAFASSTPTNLEWKVKDLIREVQQEHRYFQHNPS